MNNDNIVQIRTLPIAVTAADLDAAPVPETIEIAKPHAYRLQQESRLLGALLEAGVEQWAGYAAAVEAYRGEEVTTDVNA